MAAEAHTWLSLLIRLSLLAFLHADLSAPSYTVHGLVPRGGLVPHGGIVPRRWLVPRGRPGPGVARRVHAGAAAPAADVPLVCNMHSNQHVSFRYIIPKRFERKPVKMSVYYKMKEKTVWKLWKVYPQMVTAEIADSLDADLQPTTLYQLKVISEQSQLNDSDIFECEFCSQTDELDPVYNLTVHSVGSNWFALTWKMPPRICPREVNYHIEYHINATRVMAFEEHDDFLALSTGEHYLMIRNGILPNNTYIVSIELSFTEFNKIINSSRVSTTLKTLPEPKSLVLEKPPYVSNATNSTLKLSLHSEPPCLCTATWQYKELDETAWRFAGRRFVSEEMEITGLNASTVYQVRVLLQYATEYEPHESENVPFVTATTLPVLDPMIPEYSPQVIKATNTSLTIITDCQESCRKGYIAHWEYKKKNGTWKSAGEEFAFKKMVIKGLEPDTDYEVRFNVHWPTSTNYSKFGSILEVKTCPNFVPRVGYMWPEKRDTHSLSVQWSVDVTCRVQFLIRWKPYNTDDKRIGYSSDSFDANKCPYNATLLNCTDMNDCFDSVTVYSFTVNENITPGTRYYFEVTAMDWEGRCTESVHLETATPFRYWGGISVGLWILIIIGMLLLFASVPACILLKKRVAARMAAGRDVTFSTSCNETESNGEDNAGVDAAIFHEPTTRILDRRSEALYT